MVATCLRDVTALRGRVHRIIGIPGICEISGFFMGERNQTISTWLFQANQKRLMTRSRRVQDRSKLKRIHDLEIATERWKVVSKLLTMMEILKKEPEQIVPLRRLEQYRQQINLKKPHKVSDFIRKSPKIFELYRDKNGVVWCGLTKRAEHLVEEETRLLEEHTEKVVEYVTRFLMMSIDKRLPVDKIAHFRRDLGLPYDFRIKWIHMFPEHFRVIKIDDVEYLELTSWNPSWAVTELEKKSVAGASSELQSPGILTLPFPMKFPPNFKKIFRDGGRIEHFQKRPYLSPYAEARDLSPGSQEFDKRAVAVMHEILSFTLEKRLVTDFLTHFRWEFVMPQKLMRLFLKHYGIFYVSERGKRLSVFLTEAYEGCELIEKSPLVLWKEKILRLTGYRGRRKKIGKFNEFSHDDEEEEEEGREEQEDEEEGILFGDDDDSESTLEFEDGESTDALEDDCLVDDSEMDIDKVCDSYEGLHST
ncbi:Plant organelle RNA recognition domain-containing protein [Dioscorea alata]|uniref:Plant organelle RNA recognition domain-containing protein n=2 Tax=Dioscorea alata TaxID=55571 RepID=A0ACB7U532_DIOAL|nr:Plant organelle RNA recognition domain-containing protein [Dioscorea alata]KAH7655376.1 Plant organelle RNA recognition domain-containing protein [Dioscorea alata]